MSYPFELDGETVWDAGSQTGQLYVSLARGAAAYLELPCGLTPNEQGSCDIELSLFQPFVERMYSTYSSTRNPVLHGLTRGLLITSLVLLEQAGREIALTPEHEEDLGSDKAAFARAMG